MTSATIHTNQGDIIVELFQDHAPKAVHNFVELATGVREYTDKNAKGTLAGPFYDGSIFHRIIDGFMIQGGDPTGTGMGGPGYKFNGEKNVDDTYNFNRPYILAMANSGPNSDGSQFFITVGAHKHLNGGYSIFGEVTDAASQDVVKAISKVPTARGDRPKDDVVITSITVDQS